MNNNEKERQAQIESVTSCWLDRRLRPLKPPGPSMWLPLLDSEATDNQTLS